MPMTPRSLSKHLGPGFSTAQARAAGVGSRRLARDDVRRIAQGLYIRQTHDAQEQGHPAEWWRERQRARAIAVADSIGPNHFFARRTAAALWGLPVPPSKSDVLEVCAYYPHRSTRRTGISSSQVRPHLVNVVERKHVRLTDPATTWAMLAGALDRADAIALGDAVIRRVRIPGTQRLERPPLATLNDLEQILEAGRREHAAVLRQLLPLLSTSSASAPESHLRMKMLEWGLPVPVLDHDVYDERGRLLGCSEFAFPTQKLAVEYEGRHHLTSSHQWNRDIQKYRDYADAGWEVLQVTSALLYRRSDELKRQLSAALARRS
ncbi:hypothetical protein [Leucobacter denitrificans]|uniref:DUF559 domain-containing protein n=1 Tax=Leucobacter denitrificans TaxID=683042 RepID=A0A7G9S240_9MICO|nr:hypothetical protein [Leucobacter denitrificans]QNN61915.1 hypothetical protein H9L06_06170 [Leucobacter denitrificans]